MRPKLTQGEKVIRGAAVSAAQKTAQVICLAAKCHDMCLPIQLDNQNTISHLGHQACLPAELQSYNEENCVKYASCSSVLRTYRTVAC